MILTSSRPFISGVNCRNRRVPPAWKNASNDSQGQSATLGDKDTGRRRGSGELPSCAGGGTGRVEGADTYSERHVEGRQEDGLYNRCRASGQSALGSVRGKVGLQVGVLDEVADTHVGEVEGVKQVLVEQDDRGRERNLSGSKEEKEAG